jgi:hypothetical protein
VIPPDQSGIIAESLRAAREYLDVIVKPPLAQIGGILEDTTQYWRLRNKVNLILKTKRFLQERGITPQQLEPNIVVPLLEEASNTDDPTLADMFANLMASHLEAGHSAVHPSFAKTLGQMSPLDARILDNVDRMDEWKWLDRKERKAKGEKEQEHVLSPISVESFAREKFNVTAEDAALSFENILRLGLVEIRQSPEMDYPMYPERDVIVSGYGIRFLLATTKKPDYWRKQFEGKREEFAKRTDEWQADPKRNVTTEGIR